MNKNLQMKALRKLSGRSILPDSVLDSRDGLLEVISAWAKSPDVYGALVWDKKKMQQFIFCLYNAHESEGGVDLSDVFDGENSSITFALLMSTPAQLAEALIQAAGLWVDEDPESAIPIT